MEKIVITKIKGRRLLGNSGGTFGSNLHRDYTWEELLALDERRRAVHQRVEEPFFSILQRWDGTVLTEIVHDALFYVTFAIYILIRIQARVTKLPDFLDDLGHGQLVMIGGFLTFFLVFWVNQSHSRYFKLYHHSMSCKSQILDCATIAVTSLPKPVAYRLIRYMNAAHAAGYVGLSNLYSYDNFFKPINESCHLLLSYQEMKRMERIDFDVGASSCHQELIAWCVNEINKAQKRGYDKNGISNTLRVHVLKLRDEMGQLYNAADLPVPFFYVHFICLLTVLYLPLFSAATAYQAGTGTEIHLSQDIISGFLVVLQSIFVIGLRLLGQKMSDPYGPDMVDLSVLFYVNYAWQQSNRILKSQFPTTAKTTTDEDDDEEEEERSKLVSIGSPWDDEEEPTDEGAIPAPPPPAAHQQGGDTFSTMQQLFYGSIPTETRELLP